MANEYSAADLQDFLAHASERGLMPAATAQALAVASRNVLGVLTDEERKDLRRLDLDAVVKRFTNKRAKEFNPSSLKEYGRRVHRAVELFRQWRDDPAGFSVKTRATSAAARKQGNQGVAPAVAATNSAGFDEPSSARTAGSYDSAISLRPGTVVTIRNVPDDLTTAEAERLAQFVRMLAVNRE